MISFLYIVGITITALVLWRKYRDKKSELRAALAQLDHYAVAAQTAQPEYPALPAGPDGNRGPARRWVRRWQA